LAVGFAIPRTLRWLLVLDSLINEIKPANQRTDLLPVYSFNAQGLYLPGAKGNKKVGDTKRLSRWQDGLKKMQAEGFPIETTNQEHALRCLCSNSC